MLRLVSLRDLIQFFRRAYHPHFTPGFPSPPPSFLYYFQSKRLALWFCRARVSMLSNDKVTMAQATCGLIIFGYERLVQNRRWIDDRWRRLVLLLLGDPERDFPSPEFFFSPVDTKVNALCSWPRKWKLWRRQQEMQWSLSKSSQHRKLSLMWTTNDPAGKPGMAWRRSLFLGSRFQFVT